MRTRKGYKLFRVKDNKLYPLYVNANKPTPIGKWLDAECGPMTKDGKHVKSRLGSLAYRPGWHLNETAPYVNHIGKKNEKGEIAYLHPDHVWAEVEYIADVEYERKTDDVPKNGYYRFKTNAKQVEPWIIAGAIKVVRILDDETVAKLCAKRGYNALPRYGGVA